MPRTSLAMTLNEIIGEALLYCRDSPTLNTDQVYVGERFGTVPADSVRCVNEAIEIYNERTEILKTHRTIALYENVFLYDMPENVVRVKRVWFSDFDGWAVLPWSNAAYDSAGGMYSLESDPLVYFRTLIPRNKIWLVPAPYQDGSSFTRDSLYGLLRAIQDADTGDYMPWDANQALRDVDGVHFEVSGTGTIIREMIATTGNLRIDYVRYPERLTSYTSYPDSELPEHDHKVFPIGTAWKLLDKFGNSPEDFALRDDRKMHFLEAVTYAGSESIREIFRYGMRPG